MMQQAFRVPQVPRVRELVLVQQVQQLQLDVPPLVLVPRVQEVSQQQLVLRQQPAQQALGQLQVLQIRALLFWQQLFSQELSWRQSFSQVQQYRFHHLHQHLLFSQQLFSQGLFS
jgi:hypothetical protein